MRKSFPESTLFCTSDADIEKKFFALLTYFKDNKAKNLSTEGDIDIAGEAKICNLDGRQTVVLEIGEVKLTLSKASKSKAQEQTRKFLLLIKEILTTIHRSQGRTPPKIKLIGHVYHGFYAQEFQQNTDGSSSEQSDPEKQQPKEDEVEYRYTRLR